MKRLLLLATGGTIAGTHTDEGVTPGLTSEQLLERVPELRQIAVIDTEQVFSLDSTDMSAPHWLTLARRIRAAYDAYDGFVITHGTDTCAYGAAVLSYLIQNSSKPIVLTGAQTPLVDKDSDARRNLCDAVLYAADDEAHGVRVVFDGKVILGTRARKVRSRSYNAFASIDYPEIAVIRAGQLHYYFDQPYSGRPVFYDALDDRVCLIKLIPGMTADVLLRCAEGCRAVIIESFGCGGIPNSGGFAGGIDALLARGVQVIVTTQVPHEGSDMSVYQVGMHIRRRDGVLEAYDMTLEAVVGKVMWALAEASDDAAYFRCIFSSPVCKDRV